MKSGRQVKMQFMIGNITVYELIKLVGAFLLPQEHRCATWIAARDAWIAARDATALDKIQPIPRPPPPVKRERKAKVLPTPLPNCGVAKRWAPSVCTHSD